MSLSHFPNEGTDIYPVFADNRYEKEVITHTAATG
jgi:hypothetical protein